MKDIIKMEKISTSYIFKKINLNIQEKSFVTIVGTNNSGKTTLVKILAGLIKYDGYINIDSYFLDNFHLNNIRHKIAFVFDKIDDNFIGETVRNDLVFTLENIQLPKEEISKRLEEIVKEFSLDEYLDYSPLELPNTIKQKLAIANALIYEPKILVLDDCIDQLSVKDKKNLFKILKRYQKKGLTIIMTTRTMEDSLVSDRIIILDKGKIIIDDIPSEVYKNESKWRSTGLKNPFIYELSQNLQLYNVIKEDYRDFGKLVDAIWD